MSLISAQLPPTAISAPVETDPDAPDEPNLKLADVWAETGEITFSDILDIVNPLQHTPIISTICRAITGDKIGLAARLVGGGIYGGPIGLAGTGMTLAFEQASGRTLDGHLLAMFDDVTGVDSPADPVSVASAAAAVPNKPPPSELENATPPPIATPRAAGVQPFVPNRTARRMPHPTPVPLPTPGTPAPPASTPRPGAAHAAATPKDLGVVAAERHRIAQVIREAQKARAEMLVASLGSGTAVLVSGYGNMTGAFPASETVVVAGHLSRIPPSATPQWIGLAIEQALDKYQQNGKLAWSRADAAQRR